MALELGRRDDADRHLVAAARSRRRGPAMSRANGWLSEALRAEAAGQPRRLFAACRRGLEVLDEHRYMLGASELRAQATAHGTELAAIAQRRAAQARRPRLLLAWTERWRATALTVPAVRPSADAELNTGLAALREVTSQLEQARSEGRFVCRSGLVSRPCLLCFSVIHCSALSHRSLLSYQPYEMVTDAGSQGKLVSERSRPGSARSAFQAAQAASTTAS